MTLKERLAQARKPAVAGSGSLWEGPESSGPNGGVTFSMLTRFLSCRERFRVHYVLGLRPRDDFNHRLEYGNMWHVCEEAHAANGDENSADGWPMKLAAYVTELCRKYPLKQEQIIHWYNVCRVQFPEYVRFWAKNPDVLARTPLLQEQVFDVPYRLPSGRTVRLRGKWDAVDLIGTGKDAGIFLQENKTKGDIDEAQMRRQLTFDLQTMIYLVAMYTRGYYYGGFGSVCYETGPGPARAEFNGTGIKGVRYNVVRRPLSGGKGTIKRGEGTQGAKCPRCAGTGVKTGVICHKCDGRGRVGAKPPETAAEYYGRLAEYVKAEPETYFMRWKVEITPGDVAAFRRQCLDPILEQLCQWYDWITQSGDDVLNCCGPHWRHPFGSVNWLDAGGSSDVDEYLATGTQVGLRKVERLFEELQ